MNDMSQNHLVADQYSVLNSLLRTDLYSYTQKVFNEVTGGERFFPSWHIEVICDYLERCQRGEINRLIINIPPRSLKSIVTTVGFSSWLLGHLPKEKIICVSYSSELSNKFARDTKNVIESHWYQAIFPQTRLSQSRHSAYDFNTTRRGSRFSTSIEGTITGRGGNWIIIDDPLKPNEALFDYSINKVNEWFQNTLLSRLDDKENGKIIVIMQRIHENDLCGYLLEKSEEWTHLKIPAIAEENEVWSLSSGNRYARETGEIINSQYLSLATLNKCKLEMGSVVFSSQYQQHPAPIEGAIIKTKWFNKYDINNLPKFVSIIQSWDTASKTKEINAYSACTVFGVCNRNKYYLLEVIRERWEMPNLLRKVINLYRQYQEDYSCHIELMIEDASSGTQLIQMLKEQSIYVRAITPNNDKLSRFQGVSVKVEKGDVLVPQVSQRWWNDFENEITRFPNSKFKDQADSFSQALEHKTITTAGTW